MVKFALGIRYRKIHPKFLKCTRFTIGIRHHCALHLFLVGRGPLREFVGLQHTKARFRNMSQIKMRVVDSTWSCWACFYRSKAWTLYENWWYHRSTRQIYRDTNYLSAEPCVSWQCMRTKKRMRDFGSVSTGCLAVIPLRMYYGVPGSYRSWYMVLMCL